MCRSIVTLRQPPGDRADPEAVRAAALQYVRKVAGMRAPSQANERTFASAVDQVAAATEELLANLVVHGQRRAAPLGGG